MAMAMMANMPKIKVVSVMAVIFIAFLHLLFMFEIEKFVKSCKVKHYRGIVFYSSVSLVRYNTI